METPLQRYRCAVEATLDVVGGKWKGVIVYHLLSGTRRFNELRRLMPDVTQRVLTLHLRELEQDGIVHREVFAEVPPRVEYRLTPLGETLLPVLRIIETWGEEYQRLTKAQSLPEQQSEKAPPSERLSRHKTSGQG